MFEGALTDATLRKNWVRLRTSDFATAVRELRGAGLISEQRGDRFIQLPDGATTDGVVRKLVALGLPVFEIAPEEETLESFYLRLMKESAIAAGPRSVPAQSPTLNPPA
jgi:hypothetical protein